ncbi:MAG: FHA domain-containing protein [Rhodothermales bacterium]
MVVKLFLKTDTETDQVEEFTFEQEHISLGRDKENDIHIPDKSRVVSKKHAEITRLEEGYEIVDLGSKNFTYLNSTRLESGRTYMLSDGDVIKVGDFEVEFQVVKPDEPEVEPEKVKVPDYDRTVFESSFVNPFVDEASKFAEAFTSLCEAFDKEAPNRRIDALKDAFSEIDLDANAEVKKLLAGFILGEEDPEATDPKVHAMSKEGQNGASEVLSREPVPLEKALTPVRSRNKKPEFSEQIEQVHNVVFNVLSMLVSVPWEFRHEFVGHTIAQTPESEILFEGNGERLKNYLLDPDLNEEELGQRLALLEEGGDEVILHQLAMLDGYKAVVQQGMHMLLREIDPVVAAESLSQQGGLYRVSPNLARMVASWGLQDKFKELRAEDWSITERRAYRPSFIRAYLSRMSAGPKKTHA